MATLPGKQQGPGAMTPELQRLLLSQTPIEVLEAEMKARRDAGFKTPFQPGQHDPGMGAVQTDTKTGERRMLIPPSSGRKPLPANVKYKGRPKKGRGSNALTRSLAEDEGLIYDSEAGLSEASRPGPGVPILPMDVEAKTGPEAIIRAQSIPSDQRNQTVNKMLAGAKERNLITSRNVPLGMPDYDLNRGQGGAIEGVDTVAGQEALQGSMQQLVQTIETTGSMPPNANDTIMEFARVYGRDHPLFKHMTKLISEKQMAQ
jgi:hypothetical protein